jgi:hypothetical protein
MTGPIQSSALFKNVGAALPLSAASAVQWRSSAPTRTTPRAKRYYGPHNLCGEKYWNMVDAVSKYAATTTTAAGAAAAVCRGAWARVTINQFRHRAFQTF